MPIKKFADTSAVSISYAIDNAANESELAATEANYVPFTSEGFQLSKESQQSTAITSNRRPSGAKNTQGDSTGSAALEFGYTPFVLDMLRLAVMGEWVEEMEAGSPTGGNWIVDGEDRNFFVVEKRIRGEQGGTPMNFFERYFGNLVNEASIEISGAGLVSFTVNTIGAYGDIHSADSSADADAGGLFATYVQPADYEIADASNNIANIVIRDAMGNPLEVTFSDATVTIMNNVRAQHGVGHEFAAGMAMGKVGASLSGTIYYFDDTVLKAHLDSDTVSAEITVETEEGDFTIHLPVLRAEAPNANAQGENQDYTQSLTLNAERGEVTLNGDTVECVLAITEASAV